MTSKDTRRGRAASGHDGVSEQLDLSEPDAESLALAQRIRAEMEAEGSWRPQTRSKNPAKDHGHQNTLVVMKHLA